MINATLEKSLREEYNQISLTYILSFEDFLLSKISEMETTLEHKEVLEQDSRTRKALGEVILVTWKSDGRKQIMRKEHVKSVVVCEGSTKIEWNYGKGGITGYIKESIEEVFEMMGGIK
jgi:hypothetical protein